MTTRSPPPTGVFEIELSGGEFLILNAELP